MSPARSGVSEHGVLCDERRGLTTATTSSERPSQLSDGSGLADFDAPQYLARRAARPVRRKLGLLRNVRLSAAGLDARCSDGSRERQFMRWSTDRTARHGVARYALTRCRLWSAERA